MSCINKIQLSLNQNCEAEVTYGMILRDGDNSKVCSPNGPSAYQVFVMDEEGVTIPGGPVVSCDYIGRTLRVKVKHWYSGNSCWSELKVEDKIAPVVYRRPVFLSCTQNLAPVNTGGEAPLPVVTDGCSDVCQTLIYSFEDIDSG